MKSKKQIEEAVKFADESPFPRSKSHSRRICEPLHFMVVEQIAI